MSGIVAVFRRDGGTADVGELERLHDTLAYRGHDAAGLFHDGPVGLGHQALWTTSEAVGEEQPIAVGDVHVALAGRLDDREAFYDALPANADPETVSDVRLLAAGYHEYGVDCLDRAIGPLALALWDADRERLVCARGKTGIRHLFYAETPEAFVVGSDVATVRAHSAVEGRADDPALAAYLARRAIASDGTFDAGVRRVRPGTRFVVDEDGVRHERYWHPADATLDLPTDRASLARELRKRLQAAVAARLRTRDRPGLMMSGGLDSTGVAGVAAADLPDRSTPRPYSLVFEELDDEKLTVEERGRIRDVGERHDLPVREVVADDAGPLSDRSVHDDALSSSPCLDPLAPAIARLQEVMAGGETRVALTGHGGNALNGSRFAYADLLRNGRLPRLVREARGDWMRTRDLLLWYALVPLVPRLGSLFVDGDPDWLGDRSGSEFDFGGGLDRFGSVHRRNVYTETYSATRTFKLHAGHRMALARGMELRMPYYDPRVVEFAFSVSPIDLFSGDAKDLFLRALGDVLPPSVREVRKGRHFEYFVADGLRRERSHVRDVLADSTLVERGFVTRDGPERVLSSFFDGERASNAPWRLYAAERWLTRDGR